MGLGMGWVRLGVGGRVVMASSGGDPVLMSELWAAPGLRWRRAGGRVPKPAPGGDCLTFLFWVAVVVTVKVYTYGGANIPGLL